MASQSSPVEVASVAFPTLAMCTPTHHDHLDLNLNQPPHPVPLPVPRRTPPHVAADGTPSGHEGASSSILPIVVQSVVAGLQAAGTTSGSDALSIALTELGVSGSAASTSANITTAFPSTDDTSNGARAFHSMLGLMLVTSILLLRLAVQSSSASTISATGRARWGLVVKILIAVIILAMAAVAVEVSAALLVGPLRVQGDRDARRVDEKQLVKMVARCVAVASLFLLLIGLGCTKFASSASATLS